MPVHIEKSDGVCWLTLDRPSVRNALDMEMLDGLLEGWRSAAKDPDVRIVVLTGSGTAFCSGADLNGMADGSMASRGPLHDAFYPERVPLWKPVIAAVNGTAFAGGVELIGATDYRIAAEGARFCLSEARVGLYPAGGTAMRLPEQLPRPLAMEILLGEEFDAADALRMGFVNKVVPRDRLIPETTETAARLAARAPLVCQAIKESVVMSTGVLANAERFEQQRQVIERILASADAREGPRAFLEKRPAVFRGE